MTKDNIELLIEDYKRKLQTIKRTKWWNLEGEIRVKTKASCYRSFITELERLEKH